MFRKKVGSAKDKIKKGIIAIYKSCPLGRP